jgi:hypothetical protein
MKVQKLYGPVKVFSFIVLLLMASAIIYAFTMGTMYWNGIGV